MINLILITGFLGTGKTTLLKQLLKKFKDEKIGVIINEFGQINIDGTLIENNGILMKELNNGSIFCSCIKENFLSSLIALSEEDINYLFIEASGLADPASMPQILAAIEARTKVKYNYIGSICIVDAETFLDYYDMLLALHQQIAYSGAIIINKVDLVKDSKLANIIEKIKSINTIAVLDVSTYCQVDIHKLTNELKVIRRPKQESSNTIESRPKTITLTSEKVLPLNDLRKLMDNLKEYSYRIKGFADTDDGVIYISGVKNHIEIQPWEGSFDKTKIVIISAVGIKMVSLITKALNGVLKQKININL